LILRLFISCLLIALFYVIYDEVVLWKETKSNVFGLISLPNNSNHNFNGIIDKNYSKCSCVVFRVDDIQDYWLNSVQAAIMDTFLSKNQTLSLGLIMNGIGNDSKILEKINQGMVKNLFELDIHGWDHIDYTTLNESEQYDSLLKSNEKMQNLFGLNSSIFIPPVSTFDNETINAMNNLTLKILSSDIPTETRFNQNKSILDISDVSLDMIKKGNSEKSDLVAAYSSGGADVFHIPATVFFKEYENGSWIQIPVSEILSNVTNNIKNYGYAVIVLHPQDFALYLNATEGSNPDPINSVDQNQISDLSKILNELQSKKVRIVGFEDIIQFYTLRALKYNDK